MSCFCWAFLIWSSKTRGKKTENHEQNGKIGNYHIQSRIVNRTVNAINVEFGIWFFDRLFICALNNLSNEETFFWEFSKFICLNFVSVISFLLYYQQTVTLINIEHFSFWNSRYITEKEFRMKIQYVKAKSSLIEE